MNDCLAVILGGGRGTRLFPLTRQRSKPAVPIAGKYRIIDIPVSNCLNSELRRIFVLTQYNSESLNKHLSMTYKFDVFSSAFVTVLAAEQTEESPHWFQGTADAVRQSMWHFRSYRSREVLILSGDQLYQMDFRKMAETHRRHVADATVAVIPVSRDETAGFGILKVNRQGRIVHFEEKPGPERLDELESEIPGHGRGFLASMGIYMFSREALEKAIGDPALVDFGRHVIPKAIGEMRVQAHFYRGYWEDVGTIASYFEANLQLLRLDTAVRLLRRRAAGLHAPALPARHEGRGLPAAADARLRGVHPDGRRDRANGPRHPQPRRPRHAGAQQPRARGRLLREPRGDRPCAREGAAAGGDRRRLP